MAHTSVLQPDGTIHKTDIPKEEAILKWLLSAIYRMIEGKIEGIRQNNVTGQMWGLWKTI